MEYFNYWNNAQEKAYDKVHLVTRFKTWYSLCQYSVHRGYTWWWSPAS